MRYYDLHGREIDRSWEMVENQRKRDARKLAERLLAERRPLALV